MLGLFVTKKHKELEGILLSLNANMANNYKDNAQRNLIELCNKYDELCNQNKLKEKQIKYYNDIIAELKKQMDGYTHKDQKPYWT